jgi:hypothetical protein
MAPGTFVGGEADSVAPLRGGLERTMYVPPNAGSNAAFLMKLRLTLVHETRTPGGGPSGLQLGYATPRAWLVPGKRVDVHRLPTSSGRSASCWQPHPEPSIDLTGLRGRVVLVAATSAG